MQFTSVLLVNTVLHITDPLYKNLLTTHHYSFQSLTPGMSQCNHCWSSLSSKSDMIIGGFLCAAMQHFTCHIHPDKVLIKSIQPFIVSRFIAFMNGILVNIEKKNAIRQLVHHQAVRFLFYPLGCSVSPQIC